MNNKRTDIQVIQDILGGSKSAFTELYQRYSKFYMLTCLRYVKNQSDAQDLLQEAFIKLYRDLKQFDPERGNFISWSKRLVINVCLMHLRKNNILKDFENIIDIAHKVKVEPTAIDSLQLQDLTKVIMQLPKGYRTVFNMYVVDGFNHREIAQNLGISESTSKTQLMKARKYLQLNITEKKILSGQYA